jgi:uridine kinase
MNYPKVIAISGASGSGKTTVIKQLANEFNCPFLLFDDHTNKDTYPPNMKGWLEDGANVSLIKTPDFVTTLAALISNSSCRYIFIEEPFGKERDSMSALIDYVVLLDQPLELCLTRIIKRHVDKPHLNSLSNISNFLDKYEEYLRDIYISAVEQVKSNSDLIVDEVLSVNKLTIVISTWLKITNR